MSSQISHEPRRRAAPFWLAIFLSIALPNPSQGAEAGRSVAVGLFPAAPLVFSENGKPSGLFIELLGVIAKRSLWRIEFVEAPWATLLSMLEKGEIDLLPAVGITAAREKIYDFSKNPVFVDSGVVFASPRNPIRTIYDLEGKTIAAVEGSIYTKGFQDYIASFAISCEILPCVDNPAVMEAIAGRAADAGVCIYSLGSELALRYPVEVTAISFSPIALGYAVTEGMNADLLAAIDSEMASMVADPGSEYSALTKKWTARLLPTKIPPWVPWGLAILLLSASLFAVLALVLRKAVAARTRHLVIEIAEREKAEDALRRSLGEKTSLVHELFHRTKNILQIIEGMVALGAQTKPDDAALQELADSTVVRIEALALVHEMLYRAQDLSYLSFSEYVRKLSGAVIEGFPGAADRIAVELDIPEERMLLDIVAPLGLVLNELLTNSAKHAFPDGRRGTIRIRFARTSAGSYELLYSDDGAGLPPGFDPSGTPTLGLRLVTEICEKQLRGTTSLRARPGFEFRLDMPSPAYEARV